MSKALEDFEKMTQQIFQVDSSFEIYANKVKQHLLKAEELEKVLNIIKNKGLDYHSLSAIKQAKDFEEFKELTKNLITKFLDYTEEEFNSIKEMIK